MSKAVKTLPLNGHDIPAKRIVWCSISSDGFQPPEVYVIRAYDRRWSAVPRTGWYENSGIFWSYIGEKVDIAYIQEHGYDPMKEERPSTQDKKEVPKMSGYNQDRNKGSIKFDTGKNRLELLPWPAIAEIGKVMSFGATKYDQGNWAKGDGEHGPSWSRYYGALQRHLFLWASGEDHDDDTGLSHLAHAGCNVLFLLYFQITGTGNDDRVLGTMPRGESEKVAAALTSIKSEYPVYDRS